MMSFDDIRRTIRNDNNQLVPSHRSLNFARPVFKKILKYTGAALLYVLTLLLVWELVIYVFEIEPFLLPTPRKVLASIYFLPDYYLGHTLVTFQEAGIGALIGFSMGFVLAIIIHYGGVLGRILHPLILSSQVFPKEALAPVFLVFLGFGILPKIVISALICFFPVVVNTTKGLSATPVLFEKLMHILGANVAQEFWHCRLPFAAPYIFASLRMCTTLAVIGAVVGEFVGSSAGLGHVIRAANSDIGIERVYAALIILGSMGAVFYGFTILIEKLFFPRYTINR